MEDTHLLGVDIGTSGIKAVVMDRELCLKAEVKTSYRVSNIVNGYSHIDSQVLWSSFLHCLHSLRDKTDLTKIAGIGLSSFCPGLVAINSDGFPISDVILYSDRRSRDEAQWVKDTVGRKRFFEITGNKIMTGTISVTSMLWLKNNQPNVFANAAILGHVNSLFAVLLTGQTGIDPSNASYTGLFDTVNGSNWSVELCKELGIDVNKLPRILESSEVIGSVISREVIAKGIMPGTPVVMGGADSACAAIATGVNNEGDICESVGTTGVITICTSKPIFDYRFLNRRHVIPDRWLYQGAMSNVGSTLVWASEQLCRDLKYSNSLPEQNIYVLMEREAELSPAGANGVVFLPYLNGERSPIWDPSAKGVFFGLSQTVSRGDLLRAILESSCYSSKRLLTIAEVMIGEPFSQISLVGGGSLSKMWTQLRADITNRVYNSRSTTNEAAIGAVMLAGIGTGQFDDVDQAYMLIDNMEVDETKPSCSEVDCKVYESRYKIFCSLYPRLKDLF